MNQGVVGADRPRRSPKPSLWLRCVATPRSPPPS